MNRLLLTVSFAIFSFTLVAQKNFIPGYIVLNSGDTLVGFVNHKLSKKTATQCEFKETKKGKRSIYTPENALGYGFSPGSQFIVKDVPVDSTKTEKVFLEILVRGKVSLYKSAQQFLAEKDKLYPLETTTTRLESDQVSNDLVGTGRTMTYEQTKKTYIGILNYLFIDCQGFSKELSGTSLNERSLMKVTEKYNKCVGAEYTLKDKAKRIDVDLFAAMGYNSTSLSFSSDVLPMFKSPNATSTSPAFSLGVQARNLSGKIGMTAEIQFSKEKFYQSTEFNGGVYLYLNDYTMHYSRVKIPIGVKYQFSTGRIIPYIRIGPGFNFYTNGNFKTTRQQILISDPENKTESSADDDITSFQLLDLWATTGVQLSFGKSKAYFELRGDLAVGKSNTAVYFEGSGKTMLIDPKSIKSHTLGVQIGLAF